MSNEHCWRIHETRIPASVPAMTAQELQPMLGNSPTVSALEQKPTLTTQAAKF